MLHRYVPVHDSTSLKNFIPLIIVLFCHIPIYQPRWVATFQAILSATWECIGMGGGAVIGGFVFKHWGGRVMYKWSAYFMLVMLSFHIIHMCLLCISKLYHNEDRWCCCNHHKRRQHGTEFINEDLHLDISCKSNTHQLLEEEQK